MNKEKEVSMNQTVIKPKQPAVTEATEQASDRLIRSLDRLYTRSSVWIAFRNGIFTGLGATLGAGLILWLIGWLITKLYFVPGVPLLEQLLQSNN
jgi:hypothetical protein